MLAKCTYKSQSDLFSCTAARRKCIASATGSGAERAVGSAASNRVDDRHECVACLGCGSGTVGSEAVVALATVLMIGMSAPLVLAVAVGRWAVKQS